MYNSHNTCILICSRLRRIKTNKKNKQQNIEINPLLTDSLSFEDAHFNLF